MQSGFGSIDRKVGFLVLPPYKEVPLKASFDGSSTVILLFSLPGSVFIKLGR